MNRKKVTMRDVALDSGVSQSCVSMVLSGRDGSLPQETVQRVRESARRLGYAYRPKPSPLHRAIVMVIATSITNPFYSTVIQSIDRVAQENDAQIVTACSYHIAQREAYYLQTAIDCRYLGVIFLYPPDNSEAYEAARKKIPIVALCNKIRRISGDTIQIDNYDAGVLAARHLISLGHRRIAVFADAARAETTSSATRLSGVNAEIEKNGLADSLLILRSPYTSRRIIEEPNLHYKTGYTLAADPRLKQNGITGILCTNDLIAFGAMDSLAEQGYRIPKDYSIIGSDNTCYSHMAQLSLTTIDIHMDMIAVAAFNTLIGRTRLQRIDQEASSSTVLQVKCSVDLVLRGSTAKVGGQ